MAGAWYNKRAATRRVKHPPQPTEHNEKDKPRNRRKSKAAAKIGRRGKPHAHAPIFLRRRDPCFFITAHFLSVALFAPFFLYAVYVPLPCRYYMRHAITL